MQRNVLVFFAFLCIVSFLIYSCKDIPNQKRNNAVQAKWQEDTALISQILTDAARIDRPSDSLLARLDTAETLCVEHRLDSCLSEVLFWKGNQLFMKNNYRYALEKYTSAMELAEKMQFTSMKARCLERMASIHLGTDNRSLAISQYFQSLALCEKIGDSTGIARAYNVLALYKADESQFDTAVDYLKRAIGINRRQHDRRNMIESEGNLGYIYECSGELEKASTIYHSLVKELDSLGDIQSLPVIYYNLSSLHQRKNDNDSALYYLRKAAEISGPSGDTSMLSVYYGNTGEIYLNMNRTDSARYYLIKSVACSQAIDDVETELQAMNFLVKLDTLTGNFRSAIQWNQRIQVVKDSVYQRQLRNSSKESELLYENEKKKIQIEAQNEDIKLADLEKRLFLVILIISFVALALLVVVLIQQRKNYRRNKLLMKKQLLLNDLEIEKLQQEEELKKYRLDKAETDLKQKDKELVSIAMGLEQKNELLDEISRKLKDTVKNGRADSDFRQVNEILSSIRLQLSEQSEADLFNQRFSTIHEGFFNNLKAAYPELTPNELKFCAYLKIHLNGNQIARILNVSSEAIRKSRYRIRKKMGLDRDDSLEEQLQNF